MQEFRERLTARVVLLDGDGRILLLQGRLPGDPNGPLFWYTVGGGIEPGETLMQAAAREIVEETGLADALLGPVLWCDEAVLPHPEGGRRLFRQHYVLARTAGGPLSRAGWEAHEHDLTFDMRWWTLQELELTDEPVYPLGLARLLPDVLAGRFPVEPLRLG